MIYGINKKEKFEQNFDQNFDKKIVFELKSLSRLNLTYYDNNFYLTNDIPYIFIGILDVNGFYQLRDGINNYNFILNFRESDTSYSHISLMSPNEDNPDYDTISNLFNQTNRNIYFDPINKIILSNDNNGNKVYMAQLVTGSPVYWNYNIDNAIVFEPTYL